MLENLAKPLAFVNESGQVQPCTVVNVQPIVGSPFTAVQRHQGVGYNAMTTHIQGMLAYHTEASENQTQIFWPV